MYVLQEMPDKEVELKNGAVATPIATLKDEHGGISHIIIDDHCYVLVNGSRGRGFDTVRHWYPEAVEAMKSVNPQPEQAEEPSLGELKPCPFCGEIPEIEWCDPGCCDLLREIYCDCGCSLVCDVASEEVAIAKWNKRA